MNMPVDHSSLRIELVYAAATRPLVHIWVALPALSTLADALAASGLSAGLPGEELAQLQSGVWGCLQPLTYVLRDRDRVELYRALRVDPKEARRQRYQRDGVKPTARRTRAA